MYFGGIIIECLLKVMIFVILLNSVIKEWKIYENNLGYIFINLGYSYSEVLK